MGNRKCDACKKRITCSHGVCDDHTARFLFNTEEREGKTKLFHAIINIRSSFILHSLWEKAARGSEPETRAASERESAEGFSSPLVSGPVLITPVRWQAFGMSGVLQGNSVMFMIISTEGDRGCCFKSNTHTRCDWNTQSEQIRFINPSASKWFHFRYKQAPPTHLLFTGHMHTTRKDNSKQRREKNLWSWVHGAFVLSPWRNICKINKKQNETQADILTKISEKIACKNLHF